MIGDYFIQGGRGGGSESKFLSVVDYLRGS